MGNMPIGGREMRRRGRNARRSKKFRVAENTLLLRARQSTLPVRNATWAMLPDQSTQKGHSSGQPSQFQTGTAPLVALTAAYNNL